MLWHNVAVTLPPLPSVLQTAKPLAVTDRFIVLQLKSDDMATADNETVEKTDGYRLPPAGLFWQRGDEGVKSLDGESMDGVKKAIIDATEGTNAKVAELKFSMVSSTMQDRRSLKILKINARPGCSYDEWRITLQPRTRGKRITREDLETIIYGVFQTLKCYGFASVSTDRQDCPARSHVCLVLQINRASRTYLSIRRAFESEAWRTAGGVLPFVVGEGLDGQFVMADLAAMPHLLVGGATGQGKSVFMHGIIASLLCRQRPEDIKLLLVDTKGAEFASYSRLGKAFLAQMPDGGDALINDAGKAVVALGSLYAEMKLRRELMEMAWEVDLASYNATFASGHLDPEFGHRHLPRLVMVIDEYRDIIRQYGRSFETMLCVLAGRGHEVGIHLIIATRLVTQSVITGKIKDAFPARAAFRVSSQIDSRALLDYEGADVLLGKGDMIFSHDDAKERLQAPLIEVGEIDKLVEYVSRECETAGCTEAYTLPAPEDCGDGDAGTRSRVTERDPLFDEASRFAERAKIVTTGLLQRKFALGYNRATRLLEQLRDAGIVPDDK